MRFSSLSSGSSGNATFIASGDTKILLDCGLPVRRLAARLASIGETLDGLSAIVISHEHGDHIGGLARTIRARIERGAAISAYLTRPTAELIDWGGLERPPVKYFEAGRKLEIGDLEIMPVTIPHDCADPVGFIVTDRQGVKAGVIMDLGNIPDAVRYWLRGAQIVMLESNYDTVMLQDGAYIETVKKRISGELGHLPNSAVREFIRKDLDASSVRHLVLCHLSRHNNLPSLVREGAIECLSQRGQNCSVVLATHEKATDVIEI